MGFVRVVVQGRYSGFSLFLGDFGWLLSAFFFECVLVKRCPASECLASAFESVLTFACVVEGISSDCARFLGVEVRGGREMPSEQERGMVLRWSSAGRGG